MDSESTREIQYLTGVQFCKERLKLMTGRNLLKKKTQEDFSELKKIIGLQM